MGCCSNQCEVGSLDATGKCLLRASGTRFPPFFLFLLPRLSESWSLERCGETCSWIQLGREEQVLDPFCGRERTLHTCWKASSWGWAESLIKHFPYKWWGTDCDYPEPKLTKIHIGHGDGCLQSQPLGGRDRRIPELTGQLAYPVCWVPSSERPCLKQTVHSTGGTTPKVVLWPAHRMSKERSRAPQSHSRDTSVT